MEKIFVLSCCENGTFGYRKFFKKKKSLLKYVANEILNFWKSQTNGKFGDEDLAKMCHEQEDAMKCLDEDGEWYDGDGLSYSCDEEELLP